MPRANPGIKIRLKLHKNRYFLHLPLLMLAQFVARRNALVCPADSNSDRPPKGAHLAQRNHKEILFELAQPVLTLTAHHRYFSDMRRTVSYPRVYVPYHTSNTSIRKAKVGCVTKTCRSEQNVATTSGGETKRLSSLLSQTRLEGQRYLSSSRTDCFSLIDLMRNTESATLKNALVIYRRWRTGHTFL